jgi:hypothetical protein
MHVAMADLKLDRLLVVVPGRESYPVGPNLEAVSILHLVEPLGRLGHDDAGGRLAVLNKSERRSCCPCHATQRRQPPDGEDDNSQTVADR